MRNMDIGVASLIELKIEPARGKQSRKRKAHLTVCQANSRYNQPMEGFVEICVLHSQTLTGTLPKCRNIPIKTALALLKPPIGIESRRLWENMRVFM